MLIVATSAGEKRTYPARCAALDTPVFERFVAALDGDAELPRDLASVREAYEDIAILRAAEVHPESVSELGFLVAARNRV